MSSTMTAILLTIGAIGALTFLVCGAICWRRHRQELRSAMNAECRAAERERRLRALGFEEPTAAQRKENLDAALRDWLKG